MTLLGRKLSEIQAKIQVPFKSKVSPSPQTRPENPITRASVVSVENITKSFGRFKALDKVSFNVFRGEVLGFLGPNGAGKTTMVRILTGFFPPSEGRVRIAGLEMSKNPIQAKQKIGYLPETVSLYDDMRIQEYLEFVAGLKSITGKKRKAHLEEKLVLCGLWESRRKLIGQLSKGYRQRVGLAQALIGDPEVLILDEPTNGLDPQQIIEIRELIRRLGRERTVILSTHILPEVSMVCDRVLILNQGKVVASGTPKELEDGLKDRQEIFILIGDPHRKEEALQLLQNLPQIENVRIGDETETQVALSLFVSKDQDLRPEIGRLFVERNIPLLELRAGHLSLEEIFLKLVVSEPPSTLSILK